MPDCGKSSNSAATIRPKDSSGRTDLLGSLNVKSGTLSFNDAGEIQIVKSGIGQPSCPSQCRPPKLKDPWSWDMRRAALIRRRSETSINTNKCIPNERLYRRQTWWDRMVEVETKLTTISSQVSEAYTLTHTHPIAPTHTHPFNSDVEECGPNFKHSSKLQCENTRLTRN
eukprot:1194504-Prorocentrum_minimum.AAC.4